MPAVQSSYTALPPLGYPGMIANGETGNRISRTVDDAAGVAFGVPVFRGAIDHSCTATPTAGALLGIVIADHAVQVIPGGPAADIMPQRSTAGILTLGDIWITAGSNTTAGAAAFVTNASVITATASGNIALPGWVFDDTVASGAVVRLVRR